MEIVLIRHGRPKIDKLRKVSAAEFGDWIFEYNQSGIDPAYAPSQSAMDRAQASSFTVCSTLRRSAESAQVLGISAPDLVSELFREGEMPFAHWRHLKMSTDMWSVFFRLLQRAGYSLEAESYEEIKIRSSQCAEKLVALAKIHSKVLFVGHGVLNWFLHRELLQAGWIGPQKYTGKHWEFGVYSDDER